MLATVPRSSERGQGVAGLDRGRLEAYRRVLGELGGSRAALVTGSGAKSMTAVGLAATAVTDGRRTALVECDIGSPSLSVRLALEGRPGLAEYLEHRAEAAEILQALVLAGPVGGRASQPLVCVVAGSATLEPLELLSSVEFAHAMEKLRHAYDLVVVDAPSLSDEEEMVATVAQVDFALAACGWPDVPKRMRDHIDGVVEPDG